MKNTKQKIKIKEEKHLCAGNKIEFKRRLYYEYEGPTNNETFKEIKRIKSYKTLRNNV